MDDISVVMVMKYFTIKKNLLGSPYKITKPILNAPVLPPPIKVHSSLFLLL